MEDLTATQRRSLAIGTLIGALIGLGSAYLMIKAPAAPADNKDPQPISAGEIISLTGAAATLVRMLDDFRRRM